MSVKATSVVGHLMAHGRELQVTLTTWRDSDGVSYDVCDLATGLLLTPVSLDDHPSETYAEDLLEALAADVDSGSLDPFYLDVESRGLLDVVTAGARPGQWSCEGCDQTYCESDSDMITQHVADCDRVDGAGRRIGSTRRW